MPFPVNLGCFEEEKKKLLKHLQPYLFTIKIHVIPKQGR
jgi:hypothetical protein